MNSLLTRRQFTRAVDGLGALRREIADGAPVPGGFPRSLPGNVERSRGYAGGFGVTGVDPASQLRTPTPGSQLRRDAAGRNAL